MAFFLILDLLIAWLPYFCRAGRRSVDLDAFRAHVGGWLPTLDEVDFPPLLGSELFVQHKKPTAGSLDGSGWRDLKALPVAWFDWLAVILSRIVLDGVWPDGLLDAYIAMILKADGDATPKGQRPLCVLPVVYRLWASARLRHLEDWLRSWLPSSVYSAGGGRSSVEAWYSTALDIEDVLSGFSDSDVHVFVADVVKFF